MEVKEKIVEDTFKEFDGDILITDPFYLIREGSGDDWTNLEKLGITKYLYRNTIYGDWGCHTYNTETKEAIGKSDITSGALRGLTALFSLLRIAIRINKSQVYTPTF